MSDSLTNNLQGQLESTILDSVSGLNLDVSKNTLQRAAAKVAADSATTLVTTVNKTANQQLNDIPKTLIGVKNPVDLVSQNNSSLTIADNLSNVLDSQITDPLTSKLVSALETELRSSLTKEKQNLIDFGDLSSTLQKSVSSTVTSLVNTSLKAFTSSLFSKGTATSPVIPGVDKLLRQLSELAVDQALERIGEDYAIANTNKYLQQSRSFDVNNEENNQKLEVLKKGFTDPNANYPTKEYSGKPDTNRLATGDVEGGTVVQEKNKNRMIGAKLPGGESWDEPESAYKAEYPYNKVTQTESGHILEIDDTPGAERIHFYHKAGTYVEIDSNGSMVRRIKGSSYEIIDRNGKISILGRADISINGACNIYVGNDANIEVEGDTNITCYNDVTVQAAGDMNLSAKDNLNITSANVNIQAYNEMSLMSNVALNAHSTNAINMRSNTEITMQTVDLYTKVSNSTYHQAGSEVHIVAAGGLYNYSGGDINLKALGNLYEDSTNLFLNSNLAIKGSNSKDSIIGRISAIGVLPARKDIVYITVSDPSPLTLADIFTLDNEEGKQIAFEQKKQRDKLVTKGIATPAELDSKPVEQERADISSAQTQSVPGSESLKKATALPGNYKLSPNFTLEMLTNKAAVTKDEIETSELSYGEIVFNLQRVALNILEPVYNLYPNAFVTSGYRQRSKSTKTSQHPLGCAVDIQFKGVSKQDYFEIAKRLAKALKYDQLLLEYSAYTNNPWIHISYTGEKDRVQALTFWNNKVHSTGLVQLA